MVERLETGISKYYLLCTVSYIFAKLKNSGVFRVIAM